MKRIISLLLALLVVAPTILMNSCAPATDAESAQETDTGAESETSRDGITHTEMHGVPKKDFEGENFHSYYFLESKNRPFYTAATATYYYFTDEEASGDPMKEALWKRTELIVDHLNVSITGEGYEDDGIATVLYNEIVADMDSYQQVMLHTIYGVEPLVANGYLYDFAELPYVDLDADWWDKADMEKLRLGKIYPYGRGDFVIPSPHIVTFNKTMIDDLNLKDPYKLVDNYQWTLDEMLTMAKAAGRDVDHDGEYWADADVFGICVPEVSKFNSFLMSCGQPVSRKNSEGRLELCINTEKTVKIIEMFADAAMIGGTLHVDMLDHTGINMDRLFSEGRAMFALYDPSFLESLRDAEIDYGIVPYPMFDEYQRKYYSQDWGILWAVPKQIRNPELVGSVSELYSYFSKDTAVAAYYDKVLDGKLANDLDSRRMLDLIFESVSFDPVYNYFGFRSNIGSIAFVIGYHAINGSKDFASYYKARERDANLVIDEFYIKLKQSGGI